MCQAAHGKWLKCPDQAKGPSNSVREILDNLNTEDSEQKFCCGDIENRFCCGFTEKVREIPGFDPGTHEDSSVRYRFRHHHGYGHFGFLSYLIGFGLFVLCTGILFYCFGCVIVEVKRSPKARMRLKLISRFRVGLEPFSVMKEIFFREFLCLHLDFARISNLLYVD